MSHYRPLGRTEIVAIWTGTRKCSVPPILIFYKLKKKPSRPVRLPGPMWCGNRLCSTSHPTATTLCCTFCAPSKVCTCSFRDVGEGVGTGTLAVTHATAWTPTAAAGTTPLFGASMWHLSLCYVLVDACEIEPLVFLKGMGIELQALLDEDRAANRRTSPRGTSTKRQRHGWVYSQYTPQLPPRQSALKLEACGPRHASGVYGTCKVSSA